MKNKTKEIIKFKKGIKSISLNYRTFKRKGDVIICYIRRNKKKIRANGHFYNSKAKTIECFFYDKKIGGLQ